MSVCCYSLSIYSWTYLFAWVKAGASWPVGLVESYFAEETAIFQLILARSISNWPDRWPKKFGTLQSISWSADNWRSDIRFSNFRGCTSKTGRSNHSFFFARNHHSLMWAADLCKKTAGMGPGSGIFFFYLQNGAADEKMTRRKKVLFWPLSAIYDVRSWNFSKKFHVAKIWLSP